ncbi:MAG: sigma-54 factor interaction domain-containing protein [Verrucomicrobia bacterium]|nr:sigma-54 factor interaction domain-containing protein [Verrucomicrobiota bacterium]
MAREPETYGPNGNVFNSRKQSELNQEPPKRNMSNNLIPTPTPNSPLSERDRIKAQFDKMRAMSGRDRILVLRAENIINDRDARKLQLAEPAKPPEPARMQEGQPGQRWLDKFITTDEDLLKMKEQVKLLAPVHYPVMILGESGTGKEIIARALHGSRTGCFVAINCAAISEQLVESELFGHVKGSFTGAYNDKQGLLSRAHNGTAFLDEIGDLPYPLQAKLLRAIQQKTIRRVGSVDDEDISCRIVCATHKDIQMELNETFRLDLFYRLSTFMLVIKPLAERPLSDFMELSKYFGGTDEDAERLFNNRSRMKGNMRQVEQYFIRKRVLGTVDWE